MAPTPVQLINQALGAPDPRNRLRAIARLRAELSELEADAVRSAVELGTPWAEVGQALGVSKQSAHKRFARTVGRQRSRRRRRVPTGTGEVVVVTASARHAVRAARAAARALEHPEVETSHLLLGLLADSASPAAVAMDAIGVSFDKARQAIARQHPRQPPRRRTRVPISAAAQRTLEQALREALRLGHDHLGAEHLLLGLVRDPASAAVATLHVLDIEPDDLERCLGKVLMDASFEAR
jgi:hypothetical protein